MLRLAVQSRKGGDASCNPEHSRPRTARNARHAWGRVGEVRGSCPLQMPPDRRCRAPAVEDCRPSTAPCRHQGCGGAARPRARLWRAAGLRRVARCVAENGCWLAWRPLALRALRADLRTWRGSSTRPSPGTGIFGRVTRPPKAPAPRCRPNLFQLSVRALGSYIQQSPFHAGSCSNKRGQRGLLLLSSLADLGRRGNCLSAGGGGNRLVLFPWKS